MNTYANVILKGPQREAIVANLTAHKQRAFISPTVNGLTFVYTPFDIWTEAAEGLSSGLQCPALFAYGYDSDVFGYTLYDGGQVQDTYVSAPEDDFTGDGPELNEGPAGGNADALCRFVGADQAVAQVDVVLHPPIEGSLSHAGIDAFHQHWALAEALGLPPHACVQSYETLLPMRASRATKPSTSMSIRVLTSLGTSP